MRIANPRFLAAVVVLTILAGCGFNERLDKTLSGLLVSDCRSSRLLTAESVCQEPLAKIAAPRQSEVPLYCYATIGEIDCYSTPEPRRLEQHTDKAIETSPSRS